MAKVLVTQATERGSSAAIAAVLREPGQRAGCVEAGAVAERDGCDAVVLGSAAA